MAGRGRFIGLPLHDMVDYLHEMPDLFWDGGSALIRLGYRRDREGRADIGGQRGGNDEYRPETRGKLRARLREGSEWRPAVLAN